MKKNQKKISFFKLFRCCFLITLICYSIANSRELPRFSDEELSSVAQEWLTTITEDNRQTSSAFQLLMGLGATEKQDPYEEGAIFLKKIQSAFENDYLHFNTENHNALANLNSTQFYYRKEHHLPFPSDKAPFLCNLNELNCFRMILSLPLAEKKEIINDNSVLIQRFLAYLKDPNFIWTAPASVTTPAPDWKLLMKAHQLFTIQMLAQLQAVNNPREKDNIEERKQIIQDYLALSRSKLDVNSSLTHKGVHFFIFNNALNVTSRLIKLEMLKNQSARFPEIKPLSAPEVSLCYAIKYDWVKQYHELQKTFHAKLSSLTNDSSLSKLLIPTETMHFYLSEYANYCLLSAKNESIKNKSMNHTIIDIYGIEQYLVQLKSSAEKKKMALTQALDNQYLAFKYEDISNIIKKLAPQSAAILSPFTDEEKNKLVAVLKKISNLYGKILLIRSFPDYKTYLERNLLINAKIDMINYLSTWQRYRDSSLDINSLPVHPLFKDQKPQLNRDKTAICFEMPDHIIIEDIRCLPITN